MVENHKFTRTHEGVHRKILGQSYVNCIFFIKNAQFHYKFVQESETVNQHFLLRLYDSSTKEVSNVDRQRQCD